VLTFDKLKLVTNINDIEVLDTSLFNITYKNDVMASMKFYQDIPYLLMIKIDFECSEAVIEFTGKILKSEYKKLISAETIRQCFDNINEMGFCRIDVEEIYDSITRHKSTLPQKTLRDAIGGLPRFRPMEEDKKSGRVNVSHELIDDCSVTQHNARYHNKRDRGVFLEWIEKNLNNATQKEQLEFYQRITGKVSNHNKYRSLDWDKPSPTIVSHLYKDGLMFIHPDIEQLRSITIREAALLQSFPKDFEFLGSNAYCYKMIGNAVPVDFAKGIADAVNDVLKRIK
jgi:site-specific DNA-cytosine methylase